jgi:hypothetical protein
MDNRFIIKEMQLEKFITKMPYTLWEDIEKNIDKNQPKDKDNIEHVIELLNHITKEAIKHKVYYSTEDISIRHKYLKKLTEEIINGDYEKNDPKWKRLPISGITIQKKIQEKKRKRTDNDESNQEAIEEQSTDEEFICTTTSERKSKRKKLTN